MKRTTNKVSGHLTSVYLMAIIYCGSEVDHSYLFPLNNIPIFLPFFCIDFSLLFKCITNNRLKILILFHLKSQYFLCGCFVVGLFFFCVFFLVTSLTNSSISVSDKSIPVVEVDSSNVLDSSVLKFFEFAAAGCFKVKTEISEK